MEQIEWEKKPEPFYSLCCCYFFYKEDFSTWINKRIGPWTKEYRCLAKWDISFILRAMFTFDATGRKNHRSTDLCLTQTTSSGSFRSTTFLSYLYWIVARINPIEPTSIEFSYVFWYNIYTQWIIIWDDLFFRNLHKIHGNFVYTSLFFR